MRNIQIHWSMRIFKGSSPLTIHETREIYEVPFSGPYDWRYMCYTLRDRLIPKDIRALKEYVCAVEVEEWDKALTIQVRITRHYDNGRKAHV